jgi:hypothetical protein
MQMEVGSPISPGFHYAGGQATRGRGLGHLLGHLRGFTTLVFVAIHTAALACSLALCNTGIKIAINNAMIAITTRSSIEVKPFDLSIINTSLFYGNLTAYLYLKSAFPEIPVPGEK